MEPTRAPMAWHSPYRPDRDHSWRGRWRGRFGSRVGSGANAFVFRIVERPQRGLRRNEPVRDLDLPLASVDEVTVEVEVEAQIFECAVDVDCRGRMAEYSDRACTTTELGAEELLVFQCQYDTNGLGSTTCKLPSSALPPDACEARCIPTAKACVPIHLYAEQVGPAICSKEDTCGDGSYTYDECMRGMERSENVVGSGVFNDGLFYDSECAADWIERLQSATCDEFNNWTGSLACSLTCKPLYGWAGLGEGCGDNHHSCGQGLACRDAVCVERCEQPDAQPENPELEPR